jgi:hypothetical protein
VPTGKVNTNTTSLTLIGRDVTNYGRYYNQNLVKLLGNFANELPPVSPIAGQLWYDLDLHKLKVYDSEFKPLNAFPVTDFQPIGQEPGEFWYDTERHELDFMDDNGQYQTLTSYPREQISGWKHPYDPVKNNGTGTSAIVEDVTLLKSYGWTVGALSTQTFTASLKDSTSTFSLAGTSSFRVAAGLTIIGELQTTVGTFDRITVRGSTEATSTTTGALTVQGGASIRGNLHVGGEIVAQKLTVELTTVTTTVVVTDDIIRTENTTTSVSPTTGALIVAGGVGIGNNIYIANTATIGKNLNVANTATIGGGIKPLDGTGLSIYTSRDAVTPAIRYPLTNSGTGYPSIGGSASVSGGSGLGMIVQYAVSSGTVIAVSFNNPGTGYQSGDVITILAGNNDCQFTLDDGGDALENKWTFGENGRLNVPGSIIPLENELYDLGSPDRRFRTLYISSSTINFGNVSLSATLDGQIAIANLVSTGTSVFGVMTATSLTINGAQRINSTLRVVGRTTLGVTTCTSFFVQNATVGQNFLVNGAIYSKGNITAYYGSPSDKRFKENVQNIENALAKVKEINGVTFDWTQEFLDSEKQKSGFDLRKHDLGVIAQDVEAVAPEVVDTREDGFKFVKYEKLAGLLIEAIKELDTKLEDIKKHIGM